MAKPTALITGLTGQDGAYLAKLLLEKGYRVVGGVRRVSGNHHLWRLDDQGITDRVEIVDLEMTDQANITRVVREIRPSEVYNLAAQSFVGVSFKQAVSTADITGLGALRLLEALREEAPDARFYQASTSEMYGNVGEWPQGEMTRFVPQSPYASAKLFAHSTAVNYRAAYGLFTACGILFNHESPLRGPEFVTRKISLAVARIAAGQQKELVLGNLQGKRDWGFAPEYVEGMWRMLQQDRPDDFVLATGVVKSVQDFVEAAFDVVGLDWRDYVKTDAVHERPSEVHILQGDASKAERVLGWKARTSFEDLVRIMVEADIDRVRRGL